MLRFFVLLLLLLNGLYFAWSHELLRGYGFGPTQTGEPQRLSRQIQPEAIRILSAKELADETVSEPTHAKSTECLQAGLFDARQADVLRQALKASLPEGAWILTPVTNPARWIVYMGKYPNTDALLKKRKELLALKLTVEPLRNPNLEPGISLGGFETQAAANAALVSFNQRGVKTANVVLEQGLVTGSRLKLPAVDDALRARLSTLKPEVINKPLQTCG